MTEPWEADVDVTGDLARALIEEQFGELAGAPIEPLGEGWDNAAFLVGAEYVFRFPRRAVAAPLMVREIAILPMLAAHLPRAISVARLTGRATDSYPWPFAGYRAFGGRPASASHLDDAAYARLAAELGTFLSALHRIDPAPAIDAGLTEDEIGRLDHAQRMSKLDGRFDALWAAGLIGNPAPLQEFLHDVAPQGPRRERLCIVHGDLYAKHVFVDENGAVRGVIDWGDIHLGDPAIDVSVAFELLPARARTAFVQAYGPIDERTRQLAQYRAIYHAALVAYYGYRVGSEETLRAGLSGLNFAAP